MKEKRRVHGNEYRTTIVCVDSYIDGELRGSFSNPYMKTSRSFRSLTEFLLSMDDTLNEMNFPQSFNAVRTFASTPSVNAESVRYEPVSGALATFAVKVIFRQNASWQGSITWLEGKSEESFRSVLELIFLIDSALRAV